MYDIKQARELIERFNRAEVNFAVVAGHLPGALAEIERLTKDLEDSEDALAVTTNSREYHRRRSEALRALGRQSNESLDEYVARLDRLQSDHYEGCPDCNYDKECVACCADGDGGHSCSCSYKKTDHGYGYQLGRALEVARLALLGERALKAGGRP